jgi:predicted HAD superfamily hydrolase
METRLVKDAPEITCAADLIKAFNQYEHQISTLSLDCFDTLLWRTGHKPTDMFYDLQHSPSYQKHHVVPFMRVRAEEQARQLMYVQHRTLEVSLLDIYRTLFPDYAESELQTFVEDEISAEIHCCYAFQPMIELIRHAKNKGKKVIIISNIYLHEHQLRRLLSSALPDDVMKMIDKIFCSCDYKKSKSNGLFHEVLKDPTFEAHQMLHLGDNKSADFDAAREAGLNAMHFIQNNLKIEEFMRLQSIVAGIMLPDARDKHGLINLFHSLFSTTAHTLEKAESIHGYMSLGPVMYAFSQYLSTEIKTLTRDDKQPKVLFLMRDAHILALASEVYAGKSLGPSIRISRASALSASLRTQVDIERYISAFLKDLDFLAVCRQLFLSDEISAVLINTAEQSATPIKTFIELIKNEKIIHFIIQQSLQYAMKLKMYLQKNAGLAPGDTVILVDVGYAGTVQRSLKTFFKEEMEIEHVYGRYLISTNSRDNELKFSGLIDLSWCDYRTLTVLSTGFVLMEEIFSSCDESVIEYDNQGLPIYAPTPTSEAQRFKTKKIQEECLRFMHDAKQFLSTTTIHVSSSTWQQIALIDLTRMLYLPVEEEITYLQDFQHEKNAKTTEYFPVFNHPNLELESLRKKGLFFKNQHPYGLRHTGLDLVLTVLTQRRFGFDVNLSDRSLRYEHLPIVIIKDNKPQHIIYKAQPTHDGYYSCWIPTATGGSQIAILFGLNYHYIQLETIEAIPEEYYLAEGEGKKSESLKNKILYSHMLDKGGSLFECTSKSASIMLELESKSFDYGIRVTYRPIVKKDFEVF